MSYDMACSWLTYKLDGIAFCRIIIIVDVEINIILLYIRLYTFIPHPDSPLDIH